MVCNGLGAGGEVCCVWQRSTAVGGEQQAALRMALDAVHAAMHQAHRGVQRRSDAAEVGLQPVRAGVAELQDALGVAVGVFYWVMPICGVIILVYSVLNIIGIANGSICLDTPEDADFAKVEAEMAADADKENKED